MKFPEIVVSGLGKNTDVRRKVERRLSYVPVVAFRGGRPVLDPLVGKGVNAAVFSNLCDVGSFKG